MSRFNRELQLTLQSAMREAMARRNPYLTVEHLLYALLHDSRGAEVLRHVGADLADLKEELRQFLDEDLDSEPGTEPLETGQTLAFHRAIQAAIAHAENAERDEVEAGDLIAALFQDPDTHAVALLRAQGVSRLDVLKYISHGISRLTGQEPSRSSGPASQPGRRSEGPSEGEDATGDPLRAFATNLTELAREGKLDFAIRPITEAEVRAADEIWLSSSTKEVLAVTTLDGKPVGAGVPGPVFRRMHALFQEYKAKLAAAAAVAG